ncbi:S-DNA-T family DNA segregation ATPase FtsK/SpoIIIE [Inquilinus ginsengisoli]|uniref:DNA translocase FtsK n=1 Tax=Inquilinus ginsengisoli TaxID=363840 RepID=A0ABU1JUD2_9PROT|nr:DNA translocase FtsK 4TM domain-containing protein [Inquilinus ginsengisoli]MDR6292233.1 S-DNA-T family DNA segregation ATPase FtsK/SpoIIIE [Inquilinus ginsengisoli]
MTMAGTPSRGNRTAVTRSSRGAPAKRSFLPPVVRDFLRNRVRELSGLGIATLGCGVLVALVSYDHADPSWNTAKAGMANNLLGRPGAHLADLLIQTLGIGAFLLAVLPLFWAWRLMRHQPLDRLWWRVTSMLFGVLLLAAGLSPLPAIEGWAARGSLGGVVGSMLLHRISDTIILSAGPVATFWLALAVGALGLLLVLIALGLSPTEWQSVGAVIRAVTRAGWAVSASMTRTLGRVLRWLGLRTLEGAGTVAGSMMRREPAPATAPAFAMPEAGPAARPRFARANPPAPRNLEPGDEPAPSRPPIIIGGGDRPAIDDDYGPEEDDDDLIDLPSARPVVEPPRRPVPPQRVAPAAIEPPARRPTPQPPRQTSFELAPSDTYELPPLDLLTLPDPTKRPAVMDPRVLEQNAAALEQVLSDFGVRGSIVKVNPGPVVTLYELEPAPGTKSSRVIGLADDIARSMSAVSVRVAVVPGRNVIGIELPNPKREMVLLRELLDSDQMEKAGSKLGLVLGKDIGGGPIIADLARMPHLLVAGTTGSGKSVAINTMILSLLFRLPPDKVRFIMVDPKMLELSIYEGIPHLLAPVVTDPKKSVVALKWAVREMEDRYRAMSKVGVRNIEGYNQRLREAKAKGEVLTRRVQTGFDPDTGKPLFEDQPIDLTELPYIVIIVDEMADLMLVAGKDIEALIQRLAQMARAAGLHLIMATQRPSVDVITGTIKANFPTRISFQVTSKIDSRTILGEGGAEQLLGQGDMLYMAGGGRITRVHGPFVSDGEVEEVVRHLKAQGEPAYNDSVLEDQDDGGAFDSLGLDGEGGSGDDLYDQAVALVARERKASTSFIQRHLQIGYNRAARLIERMEQEGVVSPANHVGKREVLAGNH